MPTRRLTPQKCLPTWRAGLTSPKDTEASPAAPGPSLGASLTNCGEGWEEAASPSWCLGCHPRGAPVPPSFSERMWDVPSGSPSQGLPESSALRGQEPLCTPVPNSSRPLLPSRYPAGARLGTVVAFVTSTLSCSVQAPGRAVPEPGGVRPLRASDAPTPRLSRSWPSPPAGALRASGHSPRSAGVRTPGVQG